MLMTSMSLCRGTCRRKLQVMIEGKVATVSATFVPQPGGNAGEDINAPTLNLLHRDDVCV
jgi:hypothetical protein